MEYKKAIEELKQISNKLETENLDLGEIEALLEQAEKLTAVCRESLRRVSDKLTVFQQSQFSDNS